MDRVHQSLLTGPERIALNWLVRRMPGWVTPDLLTAIGVLGSIITCLGYALCWISVYFLFLACFGLVVHWFGDSLDGNLARYRKIERPRYGFFLDQNVDVLGNLFIGVGVGISPYVRLETALLSVIGYHMTTIYVLVRLAVDRIFHVTVLNSGPTEVRALLLSMNFLILMFGAPRWTIGGVSITWCDIAVALFGLISLIVFGYLVWRDAKRLRVEDDADRSVGTAGRSDQI